MTNNGNHYLETSVKREHVAAMWSGRGNPTISKAHFHENSICPNNKVIEEHLSEASELHRSPSRWPFVFVSGQNGRTYLCHEMRRRAVLGTSESQSYIYVMFSTLNGSLACDVGFAGYIS